MKTHNHSGLTGRSFAGESEEFMDDNEIRSMLVDIVESGNFPSDSFEIRHIEEIYSLKVISENKVRFWVERHPHLFGKPTLGNPSSAYIPKCYLYELDTKIKEVILIKKEQDKLVINYCQLGMEAVDNYFDSGGYDYDEQFNTLKSEAEVIEFAGKEVKNLDWVCGFDEDELPPGFIEKYMAEIRKQFVDGMLTHWKSYKKEFGK